MAKDNDSDVDGTEDRKLVGLLEQAAFALEESAEKKSERFSYWL